MDGYDAVEVDALLILICHHLKLRMLHDESLTPLPWASEDNDPGAGEYCLLNMEEIEPAQRDLCCQW